MPGRCSFWVDLYGATQRAAGVNVIPDEDCSVYRLSNRALSFLPREADAFLPGETQGLRTLEQTASAVGAQSCSVFIPRKFCAEEVSYAARGVYDGSAGWERVETDAFRKAGYAVLNPRDDKDDILPFLRETRPTMWASP